MSRTADVFRCVHCGKDLEEHSHSPGYAVSWCPGKARSQIYLPPWQAAAGYCVRCGQERAHHRTFADGRLLCHWFEEQTFLAATTQGATDLQAWDEAAEAMRQAMTTVVLILQLHFAA